MFTLTPGMRSNVVLFQKDMVLALSYPFPRTPHYSPMLHNAILAIALGFSEDAYLRRSSTRTIFAAQAKSFIDEEGMTPSVATVQAFAHIASYHSLGAEHNLGWLYIGMALRCAIARKWLAFANVDVSRFEHGIYAPSRARSYPNYASKGGTLTSRSR